MNKLKKYIGVSIATLAMVFTGSAAMSVAQSTTTYAGDCGPKVIFAIPSWFDGLCKDEGGKKVIQSPAEVDKISGDTTGIATFVSVIAMNIVTILLYVVGYVSLGFTIWGGFKYIINGDNPSGVSAAKKTILNAVIGLVISIMAIAIVNLISGAIVK